MRYEGDAKKKGKLRKSKGDMDLEVGVSGLMEKQVEVFEGCVKKRFGDGLVGRVFDGSFGDLFSGGFGLFEETLKEKGIEKRDKAKMVVDNRRKTKQDKAQSNLLSNFVNNFQLEKTGPNEMNQILADIQKEIREYSNFETKIKSGYNITASSSPNSPSPPKFTPKKRLKLTSITPSPPAQLLKAPAPFSKKPQKINLNPSVSNISSELDKMLNEYEHMVLKTPKKSTKTNDSYLGKRTPIDMIPKMLEELKKNSDLDLMFTPERKASYSSPNIKTVKRRYFNYTNEGMKPKELKWNEPQTLKKIVNIGFGSISDDIEDIDDVEEVGDVGVGGDIGGVQKTVKKEGRRQVWSQDFKSGFDERGRLFSDGKVKIGVEGEEDEDEGKVGEEEGIGYQEKVRLMNLKKLGLNC